MLISTKALQLRSPNLTMFGLLGCWLCLPHLPMHYAVLLGPDSSSFSKSLHHQFIITVLIVEFVALLCPCWLGTAWDFLQK